MSTAPINLSIYVLTKIDELVCAMLIAGHLVTLLEGLSQHNCMI